MLKYVVALILFAAPAFAQEATPSQIDLVNSYVKSLEAQVAFRTQQAAYFEAQVKNWIEYAKPLYEKPPQTSENK